MKVMLTKTGQLGIKIEHGTDHIVDYVSSRFIGVCLTPESVERLREILNNSELYEVQELSIKTATEEEIFRGINQLIHEQLERQLEDM